MRCRQRKIVSRHRAPNCLVADSLGEFFNRHAAGPQDRGGRPEHLEGANVFHFGPHEATAAIGQRVLGIPDTG